MASVQHSHEVKGGELSLAHSGATSHTARGLESQL